MSIKIKIVNQLNDNYSYVVYSEDKKNALIIDPSEPKPILKFLESQKLLVKGILITHHHSDHTQGIKSIINNYKTKVYSPNNNIEGTTNLLKDKDKIYFDFIDFEIISTPGHTLDHIVYFNSKEKLLFSGDTLFCYGCGRIFEGSYKQMIESLNKIKLLPDDTNVYCGHEYTYKNLEFIINEITNLFDKEISLSKCKYNISINGSSMPFKLGQQKKINPFLNCSNPIYRKNIANFPKNEGKISQDASELDFFTFIREKRNKF